MNGDGKIYDKNGKLLIEGEYENGRFKIGIKYYEDVISLIAAKKKLIKK